MPRQKVERDAPLSAHVESVIRRTLTHAHRERAGERFRYLCKCSCKPHDEAFSWADGAIEWVSEHLHHRPFVTFTPTQTQSRHFREDDDPAEIAEELGVTIPEARRMISRDVANYG